MSNSLGEGQYHDESEYQPSFMPSIKNTAVVNWPTSTLPRRSPTPTDGSLRHAYPPPVFHRTHTTFPTALKAPLPPVSNHNQSGASPNTYPPTWEGSAHLHTAQPTRSC